MTGDRKMAHEFCTCLDRRYLARGVALHRSLAKYCADSKLRVFCLDSETRTALDRLSLPGVIVTPLEELEAYDPRAAATKPTRSRVEYAWTLGPSSCLYVLDHEADVELVIRVDADLGFHADPGLALAELGSGSVLLTPHGHAPEFVRVPGRAEKWGGTFNVQFEAFRRDDEGLGALRWWRDRCVEWCFDRYEPGRYGDQKYLDELPRLFPGVKTLEHVGAGLAPWNVAGHTVEKRDEALLVDGQPLIFHHYQSLEVHPATASALRIASHTRAYRHTSGPVPLVWTTGWRLTDHELDLLWEPYVRALSEAMAEVREVAGPLADPPRLRWRRAAFHVARRRVPVRARDAYWRARELGWELRGRK